MSAPNAYTVIVVGTGFASSFFLETYLKRATPDSRVLVLERGKLHPLAWQLEHGTNTSYPMERVYENATPSKTWTTTIAFGGGSNCWWACAPRMMPNDFALRTKYGVGRDWPISYDDLDQYYESVEATMSLAGPEKTPFPRS